MNALRIGVIGCGGRGVLAGLAHRPEDGLRITACCDVDPVVLAAARDSYGAEVAVQEWPALLDAALDAVFICTPDFLHEEMTLAALERGLNVFVEKPMAITTEGCDRMLAAAVRAGTVLYVGHNMRHMPFVLTLKDLIERGTIGEVKTIWCRHFVGHGGDYYFRDWHAERRYGTGLLLQKAAHDLDVIHFLAGSPSELVNALGDLMVYGDISDRLPEVGPRTIGRPARREIWPPSRQNELNAHIDVEDVSLVNLRLASGVLAAYQQCHFTPDYWRNYTVIGSEGRLENAGNGEPGTAINVWRSRKPGWAEPDDVVAVPRAEGTHAGADPRMVEEFIALCRGGGRSTTPLWARHSVAAGCAATASLREGGRPVAIPPVDPVILAALTAP